MPQPGSTRLILGTTAFLAASLATYCWLQMGSEDIEPHAEAFSKLANETNPLQVSSPVLISPIAATEQLQDWLTTYQSAEPANRVALLDAGIELARTRHAALRELIPQNPAAALELVLDLSEYERMPNELQPYLERPTSGFANIDLRWSTAVTGDGHLVCTPGNRLYLDDQGYDLHGPGRRDTQSPVFQTPVFAYLLDDLALVPESPLLILKPNEVEAAGRLFDQPSANGIDPITGLPATGPAAVIAGDLYRFSAPAVLEHVLESLEAAEQQANADGDYQANQPFTWLQADHGASSFLPSGTEASFFTNDNISVLFIRCDFSDFPGAPVSASELDADLDSAIGSVSDEIEEMSFGKASISATVTTTLYRPANTGTAYAQSGNNDGLYSDVIASYDSAPDSGSRAAYDVVAIYFPDLGDVPNSQITYGGLASVGGSKHWINGLSTSSSRRSVITHEFGHNYGLSHSNYWHPEQQLGGDYFDPAGFSLEYGDIFDRMGNGSLPEGHFNHFQKHHIDWITDDKVNQIVTDGTYRVYRFDHVDAIDNPTLALRVPMGGDVYYWVGFRQLYTGNPNLANGAYVVAEGLYDNRPNLIDMTPESEVSESDDRFDAGLPVGTTYYDADSGVHFTSLATGSNGTGDEWIDVSVAFEPRVGFKSDLFEYDEASGTAYLTLERGFGSSGSVSVDYATTDLSATASTDYFAASGTITWADGDNADKTIAISIRPDTLVEGIEDFIVTLSNVTNGVITSGAGTTTVSILDPGQRFQAFIPDFFNSSVHAIDFQSDGSAIVGGIIDSASGDFAGAGNIARIGSDGSVDSNFNSGGTGFDGKVLKILVQPDDKILVGGEFTSYNGTTANRITRLNADGSLDTSFATNIGSGADDNVETLGLEADGEILIGGIYTSFNGIDTNNAGLVRRAANGTAGTALSLPFNSGFQARIYDLLVESDGDIVVTGIFYINSSVTGFRSGIVRLNPDGSRETGFDPDAGLHLDGSTSDLRNGYALATLPDGDYLVGGFFTAYDENPISYFARINNDGSFDRASPATFDVSVETILAEPFGGVLVGERNGTDPELTRIAGDWTTDGDFVVAGGPVGSVYSLVFAPDGSLWVGGNFFTYNGSSSRPLVRLASGVSPYEWWAAEKLTGAQITSGEADPDADPDGDGIPNLGELALGTDPNVADSSSVFGEGNNSGLELAEVGGQNYLQMTLDKSALDGGVWFGVQLSSNLINWLPNPLVPGDESAFDIIEDSQSRLIIRDKTPISPGSPRFARIVLQSPN